MHIDMSQAPLIAQKFEPAQSKFTWTFNNSHFVWKLKGKRPNANPAATFFASLRSRNERKHFTKTVLFEIYNEIAGREGP